MTSKDGGEKKDGRNPKPAFRALIADRDSMSSDLLAATLSRDKDIEASACSSGDLLVALANDSVHLVVIAADLNFTQRNGLDLARSVGDLHPGVLMVVLLSSPTHGGVIQAFRAGARGVFSRERPMSEFLECIEYVRRGHIWASGQEADYLMQVLTTLPAPAVISGPDSADLTERELQVVQCAAMGKTNKRIAQELRLSEHTVKNYLFRAFEKIGVSSRVELLFYLTMRGRGVVAFPEPREPDEAETKPA